MKVLVVTNMYPSQEYPFLGIFVKQHVDALRNLDASVDVFHTYSKRTRTAYFTTLPSLVRRLRSGQYDIVHAQHSYCMFQLLFARVFVGTPAPVLFTIHEGEAYSPNGSQDPQADFLKKLIYSKRLKRWALQLADSVVSVERRLPQALEYQRHYEVIPPGIDLELFRPMSQSQCRKELGLPETQQIAFFPADPQRGFDKGLDLLNEALGHVKQPVHLVSGGSIPHEQMPLYMNASDLIVQTSRFEASPMVAKESLACNRLLVSTDVGDVRELFGDVPGLFLCSHNPRDIAEKIEQALHFDGQVSSRERLVELGLSLEQVGHRYLDLYARVIEKAH